MYALSPPWPFGSTACGDQGAQLCDGAVMLRQLVYLFFTRESENLIKCSLQSVFLFLTEGIHRVAGKSWESFQLLILFPSTEWWKLYLKELFK